MRAWFPSPSLARRSGLPHPPATTVDPDIGYGSRVYRIPEGFDRDWQVVMLTSAPPSMLRTGYLIPVEDGRWMVGLMGAAGQHPPSDEDGFTALTATTRLMHRYLDRIQPAVIQDLAIAEIYIRVFGMMTAPTALFAPRVLAAAARARPAAVGSTVSSTPPARPLVPAATS